MIDDGRPAPLGGILTRATAADVAEMCVLQRCCWVTEAIINDTLAIPALHEDLDTVREWVGSRYVGVVRRGGRLVGAVRGHREGDGWEIGRLMVAPDLVGRGLGRWLLAHAEAQAPPEVRRFDLFTGSRSERNLRMYRNAGYAEAPVPVEKRGVHIVGATFLSKPRDRPGAPGVPARP